MKGTYVVQDLIEKRGTKTKLDKKKGLHPARYSTSGLAHLN